MLTLTAGFEAEKNKKTGAKPVWILKCPFVSGTLYLSDRVFTYTGITILPWIASWGSIDENISSDLSASMVSDFSAEIIIDPDAATDIHDLLWSEAVETINCELYYWYEGLTVATDPMKLRWTGNIIDFEKLHELAYRVDFVDQGVKWDKYPGDVLSLTDHPNAALDDVGKQMSIGYGALTKVPALRMNVGVKTSLIAAITAVAVDFYVSDSGLTTGDNILIDGEQINSITITGTHITACTRGANSTTAAAHNSGSLVIEKQATSVFLYLDHPVKSIGNIYAIRHDGVHVDVTALCTKYTGQGGANDLAGYAGMAVITCPGYITFAQAVAIGLADTIAVNDTISVSDTIVVTATLETPNADNATTIEERFCTDVPAHCHHNSGNLTINLASMPAGTTIEKWVEISWLISIVSQTTSGDNWVTINPAESGGTDHEVCRFKTTGYEQYLPNQLILPVDNAASWPGHIHFGSTWIAANDPSYTFTISSIKQCQRITPVIDVDRSGSASKTGSATKSGTVALTSSTNQYADVIIGDRILISGEGYADDGGGTFTGTASALIERPDHIFKHFLYTYASLAVANFSTDAATPFAADSYKFSVVINTRKKLREWCAYMALQCRCWFRFANSKAYLLYRPDSLVSDKTIAKFADNADFTTTMQVRRSPLDEVINVIHGAYKRDWSKEDGREAYQAVYRVEDATSIAAYGEKENPDLWLFDFITDATMMADVIDFSLARYKDRKKVATGELLRDHIELEFADAVTLTEAGGILCEVRKVGDSPGSADAMDVILLEAREY